ncbi:MAG TPA: UPF0182 family protein [Gemmatimonadaceae bacterium]|nr:UPF0182 family protein [Gemmatimonadaceae bacterium]
MNIPTDRELNLPRLRPYMGRQRHWLRWFVGALLVVFVLVPAVATRYTDWLWYRDVGFERVFLTMIAAQWTLGLVAGVLGFVALYVNARIALRGMATRNLHIRDASEWAQAGPRVLIERMASWLVLPASLVIALVLALGSAGAWRDLAMFFYRTPFGVTDPVFGRDVAYYVFTIPMVEHMLAFASTVLWVSLLLFALPVYVARGEIGGSLVVTGRTQRLTGFHVTPLAQMHVAILATLLLTVTAARVLFVDVPSLLIARHPVLFGATYTDLHVRLPLMRVLAVLLLGAGAAFIWYASRGRLLRGGLLALAGVIGATLLLAGVLPGAYQRLVVQPNELDRETPQIRNHIAATRQAWGIDNVDRRELTSARPITSKDVAANQVTIRNVRLWDREPLLQTYGQIQSIRTYYDFVSVDDDRYVIDGELRQVLLAPRELNTASLPTRTFINEHLTYTHGMGVTLGPSNQVTPEGLPVLWVKDLPPVSTVPIRIARPQIYFGELANDFILAPSRQKEFDYPSGQGGGDAAQYSSYDANAGVPVGSFARRLLFAFRFGSMNILLSNDLTDRTRILFHRDVLERAQMALPFLRFDPDPYLVIAKDGSLQWMLDAYTATDRYPYAQPLSDGTNYLRNSVKVVIDAYSGATRAYLAQPDDPMIRTLGRIYPGLLQPLAEMPADLRAHLRYPPTIFAAQSSLYGTFHMTDAETFYHREDQWQIPTGTSASGESFMRHIVMRLPGEKTPEYVLMRPFTPRQKDNLAAWMVARNDGDNYGKLVVYRFPRQSLVFGPSQIVNRMNQDTEVSRQISLWDQRGSEVIRGELLVIPIEESLIYVQPLYLRAQGGRIPELKRVVVAHESRVAMEETLEAALERLFGETGSAPAQRAAVEAPIAATESVTLLAKDANDAYERARSAQRNEDWATYGAEMKRLGEIIRRLNATKAP